MRAFRHLCALLLLLLALISQAEAGGARNPGGVQVEITEVKNVGVSANNDAQSVIQVSWSAQGAPEQRIQSFELLLEAVYADGAVEKAQTKASGAARTSRFEVPTLHRAPGRPAAELRSFKVRITANYSETATKLVSL